MLLPMKQLYTAFLLIIFTFSALAQAPRKFNYQAVARDASGSILTNQNVRVRFTIRDIAITGPILYQETHQLTTNSPDLFNTQVGGSRVNGVVIQTSGIRQNVTFSNIEGIFSSY